MLLLIEHFEGVKIDSKCINVKNRFGHGVCVCKGNAWGTWILCEIKMYDWVICDDLGVTHECELEIFERFSFDYEEGSCLFMYNFVWNYNLTVLLWAL